MTFPRVLKLLLPITALVAAQATDSERFGGTWEAKFKGTVICTIKVAAGEQLSGAMYGCAVHVNNDGDLVEAQFDGDPDEPLPLLHPKIERQTLSFEQKDDDQEMPMRLEFKLVGDGRAELRFVDAPVTIKPIRFERK